MLEDELIMFFLGLGLAILVGINYSVIKRFPASKLFFSSFYIILLAWLFTILEGFFLPNIFNLAEHIAYAASAILIAVWSYCVFIKQKGAG